MLAGLGEVRLADEDFFQSIGFSLSDPPFLKSSYAGIQFK